MSANGLFRSPGGVTQARERPKEPLLALYQEIEGLCTSAIDPYEIAVHLEARGYNRYRVQKEFGLEGVFQLAEKLYELVPRDFPPIPKSSAILQTIKQLSARYLVVLATFSAILLFHLLGGEMGWPIAIWLLAWGQMGYSLVYHAEAELVPAKTSEVKTCVAFLGIIIATALSLLSSNPKDAFSGSVFWIGAMRALWGGEIKVAILCSVAASLGSCFGLGRMSLLSAGLVCISKFLTRSFWNGWQWLFHSLPKAVYPLLYGLGQGLFLYGVFGCLPFGVLLWIMALLVGWLFLFDLILHRLSVVLNRAFWRNVDLSAFFSDVRGIFWLSVTALSAPAVAGALFFFSSSPLHVYFLPSGLWTAITGAGVWLFSLGEKRQPAVILLAAGLATVVLQPWRIAIGVTAAILLSLCLFLKLRRPLSYGLWFL